MESTEPHAIFVWNSMTSLKLTVEKLLKVVGIFLSFKLSHLWSCKGEYTGLFASKTVFCSVFFITAFDFGCKKSLRLTEILSLIPVLIFSYKLPGIIMTDFTD